MSDPTLLAFAARVVVFSVPLMLTGIWACAYHLAKISAILGKK